MAWGRFDDEYYDNPKCRAAGKDGRALDVAAILHSSKHLTDGLVPDHDLPVLAAKAGVPVKRTLRRLIDVRRWHGPDHDCERCPECPPGHHVIHDYLDYNPSAETEREKRRKRAEAGRKGGQRSRPPRSKPEANPEANASASATAKGKQPESKTGTPYPIPPVELPPPTTHVGTRPESAGGEQDIVEEAVRLAAERYVEHQARQGPVDRPEGLTNWWIQENGDGARIRAKKLLEHHDVSAIQLADALTSPTDPPWLVAYRRGQPTREPIRPDLSVVKDITDEARSRLAQPGKAAAS